jgi:ABC-type nitrate/sulfonate/bicarbonate transport system permease component
MRRRSSFATILGERPLLGALGILLFLLAWETTRLVLSPFVQGVVAFPSDLIAYIPRLIGDSGDLEMLGLALLRSSLSLGLGLGLSVVLGLVVGTTSGWYRRLGLIIDRYMMVLYMTPFLVLVPVLVVVAGIDLPTPTTMVVITALPQLYFVISGAVVSTNLGLVKMVRTFGASDLRIILTVVLPSIVPAIVSGLRQAVGRALVGVIVVELFVGRGGIGGLILDAMSRGHVQLAFTGIITLAVLNLALVMGLRAIERRVEAWKQD